MKILGLFSGRQNEMGEMLCKQALLGAKDAGCEVEAVNLRTLNLKPCTNCNACTNLIFGGSGDCVLKDDMPWLDEKLMECDGIIVVMPVFEKAPPGDFKILMDRTGPSHDVELRRVSVNYRKEHNISDEEKKGPDPRSFKVRPAAFIAHGGTDWSSMGLPLMETWAVPMGFTVAAKELFEWNVDLAFDDERLQKAYEIGKHTAESAFLQPEERKYMGDMGICPACHNNVMLMSAPDKIQCAVCGVKGELKVEGGTIKPLFSAEELAHSHMTAQGKIDHSKDLEMNAMKMMKYGFDKLAAKKRERCAVLPTTRKEK